MKSKILQVSLAVGLLLGLPGAKAHCQDSQCLETCLSSSNTPKVCLAQCCEINSQTYFTVGECHDQCTSQCSSQSGTKSKHACYSSCLPPCTEGKVEDLEQKDPEEAIPIALHFKHDKPHENYYNQTNSHINETSSVSNSTGNSTSGNSTGGNSTEHIPNSEEDDVNQYEEYLRCENKCMFKTSAFKIEKCQQSCAVEYIHDSEDAHEHKWYALHSQLYNLHNAAPLNRKRIALAHQGHQRCQNSQNETIPDCMEHYYENKNLTFEDDYVNNCQHHHQDEVKTLCYLRAQSTSNRAPEISGNVEEAYYRYLEQYELAQIDSHYQDHMTCTVSCQDQDCDKSCFSDLRNSTDEQVDDAANKRQKCESVCQPWERVCIDQCSDEYHNDLVKLQSLYQLEAYTRETSNPEYEVSTSPYDVHEVCVQKCEMFGGRESCLQACENQFHADLYNEVMKNLHPKTAFTFLSAQSNQAKYTKCIMRARSKPQMQACEDQFKNDQVQMMAALEWHQALYDMVGVEGSDTFAFHDKQAIQLHDEDTQKKEDQVQMHQDKIQQAMTIKALSMASAQNKTIDDLIEEESQRRGELDELKQHKLFNIYRQQLKEEYIDDLKQQWLTSLDISKVDQPSCNTTCTSLCFDNADNSSQIAIAAHDCVSMHCGCQVLNQSDYINLEDIVPPINSFPEFEMNQINERTIEEIDRQQSNNSDCQLACARECLILDLQFAAKEICMEQVCSCQFNLFYHGFDLQSALCHDKCAYLSNESDRSNCRLDCSWNHQDQTPQILAHSQSLFTQTPVDPLVKPMKPLKKVMFSFMFLIMIGSILYTMVKVKEDAKEHGFIERPKQMSEPAKKKKLVVKQDVYQKMSNKIDQLERLAEESFVVEGTYEKVL